MTVTKQTSRQNRIDPWITWPVTLHRLRNHSPGVFTVDLVFDDRAGWEVIDRLAGIDFSNGGYREVFLRKASVPYDLLDWLDVHSPTHIIDASCDKEPSLRRFAVSQNDAGKLKISAIGPLGNSNSQIVFDSLRSNSTHQIGLLSTLELVAALRGLPRQLCIWTVSIASVEENCAVGTETQERIDECVKILAEELCLAVGLTEIDAKVELVESNDQP